MITESSELVGLVGGIMNSAVAFGQSYELLARKRPVRFEIR